MNKPVLLATVIGLAVLSAASLPAQAQTAAKPAAASAQPVKEVYPRDLMTIRERFDMWRKMRAARTMDERMELWAAKHAELEQRAAEQGAVLRMEGPMMERQDRSRGTERGGEGERRMGMMEGGMMGGARPHPPAGR